MSEQEFHTWFLDQITKDHNGCWVWSKSKNSDGYGNVRLHGKTIKTHKYMLEHKLGRQIQSGMNVCHSCHNRACCNPEHLREDTHAENMKDMVLADRTAKMKGSENKASKLTEDQVRQIRQLNSTMSNSELARMFNISKSAINLINTGAKWKHVI